MPRPARSLVGLILLVATAFTRADEPPAENDTPAARKARLEFLQSRAVECELFRDSDRAAPLPMTKEPVLRYSNPVRGFNLSDGTTFLWTDGHRPLAVATWSLRGPGNVYREFTSLSGEPLACVREGREIWSPKTGGLLNQPLPDAPAPLASAPRRLAQMRNLAARFSAVVHMPPDETVVTELRLMAQPLWRFKEPDPQEKSDSAPRQKEAGDDVLDGALFSLAEATDPEALLLLEARREKPQGPYEWRFTLARMTSVHLIVRLDGKECFSVPNFWRSPRSPAGPYLESADGKYEK